MTQSAIVLFGHGARDPEWTKPFEAVTARLRCMVPDAIVATAFLEFNAPDLNESVATLVAAGADHITIAPLFIAVGAHLKRDLPWMLDALGLRYPSVRFDVLPALGDAEEIIEALAQWIVHETQSPPHAQ